MTAKPPRRDELQALRELSAALGADRLRTQGAGGNTSIKRDGTLWIKASGTWLSDALAQDIMTPIRLDPLLEAIAGGDPRAATAVDFVDSALNPRGLRPSIETSVHAIIPSPVVVHIHCVHTIALAVRRDGEGLARERMRRLSDVAGVFVPYRKPGLPLAQAILERLTDGANVFVLANHGLVVAGETVREVADRIARVCGAFAARARPAPEADLGTLASLVDGTGYRMPQDPSAHSLALDPKSLAIASRGSLYPDHVVFLGPGLAKGTIVSGRLEAPRSHPPLPMLALPGMGVALHRSASKNAEAMALCLADVAARIPEEAETRALTRAEERELMNWEAETYRQSLAAGTTDSNGQSLRKSQSAMSARVIGIDVGTSGVRAAALDERGALISSAAVAMADFGDPTVPDTWWRCVRAALADLGGACDLSWVRGLAVDATSGTMLAVDRLGEPVGPARMYDEPCDDKAVMRALADHAPADSAARGATSGLARVLMMQDRPGVRRLLHQADWIAGRLSGRFDRSDWNNALKTGYDPVAARWPAWIERAGADVGKLPFVLEPGAPVGPVSPEAVALGLPVSAIVHAGTTDGCASFLATGAAQAGDGVTALGSTLVVKLLSDRPLFAPEFGIYSHRVGSVWLAGGASNTGGKVIERFFARERLPALSAGLRPEAPTGLNYYPLLRPGERFPINDPALPPRLEPRPEDETMFFQAILEGIAAVEALAYAKLAELGAPAPRSIRTVGGGAQNAGWTKIRERKLGVPFAEAESQHACVGVARLALRRLEDGA